MLSFMSIPIVFRLIKHSFLLKSIILSKYLFIHSFVARYNIYFIPNRHYRKKHLHCYLSDDFLIVYIFYVLGKAVYKKRMYSIWHYKFYSNDSAFLNDLLYITNQSTTGYLFQIGSMFLYFSAVCYCFQKYAESIKKVLELKDELEVVNRNLESTVEVRTKELSEANTKLNIFLRQKNFLISTLSHDLKTLLIF